MKYSEIVNKETGGKLIIFEEEDFEYESPIKHYKDNFIVSRMQLLGASLQLTEESKKIFIELHKDWYERLNYFKGVEVPQNLIKLLNTTKKSAQESLLKDVVLTPDNIMAFLIKAEELGFTLSQYRSEHPQKGLDLSKIPFASHVESDGSVKIYGKTELSDAQLKQAVQHRKVKIAKFLDKGNSWHCFFTTYKSLRGEETWLGEDQPHYHYISSSFGINRAEVVIQLKSEKYKLGNLPHIKFEDYHK